MIAIDTETTGVNFFHGAKPYLVTTCTINESPVFYEWNVHPHNRQPTVPPNDVQEIRTLIESHDILVFQNAKFDVHALNTIGLYTSSADSFPWHKVRDTLLASHLLESNQKKSLDVLSERYLGHKIVHLEDALEIACKQVRDVCRRRYPAWRIAKEGLPEMPSAKKSAKEKEDKTWKYDSWLPRNFARLEAKNNPSAFPPNHTYFHVTNRYANADSEVTIRLWPIMEDELRRRGLWNIYLQRLKLLPIAYALECRGATQNGDTLDELVSDLTEDRNDRELELLNLAQSYDYPLTIAKGAALNQSMRTFAFDILQLPKHQGPKSKTSAPSLDKNVIALYLNELEPRSKGLAFIRSLVAKREADKCLGDAAQYKRYRQPITSSYADPEQCRNWFVIRPNANPVATDTLRWSYRDPNLQNVGKQDTYNMRLPFGPAPYRLWIKIDYENLELRIPAYESGEPAMIELFEQPNKPPYFGSYHLLNASIVYPDLFWPIANIKGEFKKLYAATWYQWIKNGGFALIYGCQEDTFDRTCRKHGGYALLCSKLPNLFRLNDYWIAYANKHGFVETLPNKRVDPKRGYPVMCSRSSWGSISPTIPLNYHVSPTAMQCTNDAMIRCSEQLDDWNTEESRSPELGNDYYMTLQVHDEIVFDFPLDSISIPTIPDKVDTLKRLMELSGDDIGIPLPVSGDYCPVTWAKGEKWETVESMLNDGSLLYKDLSRNLVV